MNADTTKMGRVNSPHQHSSATVFLFIRSQLVDDALDLDSRLAEIEQQAQLQSGRFQVVEALRHMHVIESFDRLQFDKN